ncbi:hypothetical protein QR680_001286 [Steinernema hermaphroditum]|uniref:Uncharacterized protein n=1 Tax=Steinernema hermaphroditum TaxID=289476 RepID=A0AA39GYI3_9BILA|nr:hypothetical protein QR680_001286 [Steinernema hermaphroditum]
MLPYQISAGPEALCFCDPAWNLDTGLDSQGTQFRHVQQYHAICDHFGMETLLANSLELRGARQMRCPLLPILRLQHDVAAILTPLHIRSTFAASVLYPNDL